MKSFAAKKSAGVVVIVHSSNFPCPSERLRPRGTSETPTTSRATDNLNVVL